MKKNLIRKGFLFALSAAFMTAAAAGIAVSTMQSKSAAAESLTLVDGSDAWETGVFEMIDGVSLKLNETNGLRFIVKMDEDVRNFVKTTEDAEIGFIIAPESLMQAANGDYINMPKYVGGAAEKNKIYQAEENDGYYYANGCITNFNYKSLTYDFVAISYIKYGGEIRYTEYNDKARNNVYDTVNTAVLNGYAGEVFNYESYTNWYGTADYPITVETAEEYNAVVNVVDELGVDLSSCYMVVRNDATPTKDFENVEYQPTVLSAEVEALNKLIYSLPDEMTMPNAVTMVARIQDAKEQYEALSDAKKAQIENYAKVEKLLPIIEGYDRVYKHDADDGTVIPAYVPNYTSAVGGSATTRMDALHGNVLTVKSDASGRAALYFGNFPSIAKYGKIYFYVKVSVACDLYLSDGITNDGWGDNHKNTWSASGYWCNADNWRMVEIDPASGYIGTNFALGFRTKSTGITIEISDIYGLIAEKTDVNTKNVIGNSTDSGTTNEYGKVYNYVQSYDSETDLHSFAKNSFSDMLHEGHDGLYLWIYNPNTSDVDAFFKDTVNWKVWDLTTLKAQSWTKFVISSASIEKNKEADMVFLASGGANTAGWQVSEIYSFANQGQTRKEADLSLGVKADTGTSNEYGKVYTLTQGQWFIDNNVNNTLMNLAAGALANALPAGYEYFYFWMYNPTATAYNFHLAGDCSGDWTDSKDSYPLTPNAWTQVTISADDIALNKLGVWYVYILGGDGAGAAKSGWQISPIYAGPDKVNEIIYLDHADVKEVVALIDEIPDDVTLEDKAVVETARAAYDELTVEQQAMVGNAYKLFAAEAKLANIEAANKVIDMIDSINPRDLDESLVEKAREAYDALSEEAKSYVTNLATLEGYEADIQDAKDSQARIDNVNSLIANFPDSVMMPDHLVFVGRIEAAKDAYDALSSEEREKVQNYAKLKTLVDAIEGYTLVYGQTLDGVQIIPSHVPNNTSDIGGTASIEYDGYYGTYLRATPDAGGKVSIQFINFPDVSQYVKLYFNVRVVGTSCDIYLSDGLTAEGNNSWNMDGFWVNGGSWFQKEVNVSTGIFSSNWVLGLKSSNTPTDVVIEIADIVGVKPELGTKTDLTFGNFESTGTVNEYGPVNNLTQGWGSDTALGAFNPNILNSALKTGDNALRFYIYNPNASDLTFYINYESSGVWTNVNLNTIKAQDWSEVVLTEEVININKTLVIYMCVSSGAGTAGWQISPLYSFSSMDTLAKVQARIDALSTASPDAYQAELARKEYEALSENEKALIDTTNLITCEQSLYGDVAQSPFIQNGKTYYKIYIEADNAYYSAIKGAVDFAHEHMQTATGANLPIVEVDPVNLTKYRNAIIFGHIDLYKKLLNDDNAYTTLEDASYKIHRVGRTVFIMADSKEGYHLGTLAFLREAIGYDMLSEDCVVYDLDKATALSTINLTEIPSFEYRQKQTYMTETELYGMGIQSNVQLWIPSSGGWDMHNTLHYLPTATYQSAHPAWYYTYTDSINVSRTQICPTAGGTKAEFDAMVAEIAKNMLVQINAYPDRENISFSIMDTADGDDCTCARCGLYDTLYGEGGFAAAWIDLMNAVNAKVRESLPAGRKLNIAFLAYRGTEKAPASIDANGNATLLKRYEIDDSGNYTQTNEYLQCDEGVTVWLAPINAKYAENFNDPVNAEHLATVKKWCAISSSVYVWAYGTNFKYYMYPYNSWQASAENYKIFKELGVKAVWSQSNETEATAFSDLKGYIDSKFMLNVNANYETVLSNYFSSYFGAGATKMREMFNTIVARCNEIEAEEGVGQGIYDEYEYETGSWFWKKMNTYWTEDELNALVALCNEAKAAVNADTSLSDEEKTAIVSRITKESLFPRYVLCSIYKNTSDHSAFAADCRALGLTLYKESEGSLEGLFSDWGV